MSSTSPYRLGGMRRGPATASSPSSPRLSSGSKSCCATAITIRPRNGMGMWRAVALLACLSVAAQASVFSEGGLIDKDTLVEDYGREAEAEGNELKEYEPEDVAAVTYELMKAVKNPENYNEENYPLINELVRYENTFGFTDAYFEILDEFHKNEMKHETEQRQQEKLGEANKSDEVDSILKDTEELILEELAKNKAPATKIESAPELPDIGEEEPLEEVAVTGEPHVPQKKGQNEFVSFVEPVEQPLKQTKSVPAVDKRRLSTSAEFSSHVPRYSSSSLLLIAVGTVMSVGVVGTVAGGAYYWKRRHETPDDGEYAPYAGTGPGYKKNKGNKGDETLAYKAQLHQYQQAKQKIICGEDAPGIIDSDGEDCADEENNFSVYECPGLAPTGDIEVCNPNFTAQP
ncbi:unnamed protein product [Caenorhabditis bovis]|uniref:Uncharacterized protein n=1 Tax=Caenorhabditis bovis TaxID=2654633 RepID=A0A8S1EL02_9PELO|nr:unnamed protein product [Caenorhabditis bovis]